MTLKVSLIVSAVDQATAPVQRINRALDQLAAGPRAIAASLGRLAGEIGLNTVATRAGNVVTSLGGVATAASRVGVRMGALAGLGGGGLLGLVKHTASVSEEMALASQRLGVNVEQYQKLTFAASQSGVQQEQFGEALKFLSSNAVEAATGSAEAAQWFRAAGVSVRDANGQLKGADQLFLELSDAFAKSNKSAEIVKVSMALMGRSGADMIPFMKQGGAAIKATGDEAVRFGLVRTPQAIDAAKDFGDRLDAMGRVIGSVALLIGDKLIPKLDPLVVKFTELLAASRPLIETKIDEWIASFEAALPSITAGLSEFGATISSVGTTVKFLGDTFGWGTTAAVGFGLYLGGPLIAAVANVGVAMVSLVVSVGSVIAKFAALTAIGAASAIWNLVTALRAGYGAMAALNLVMAANPIGLLVVAATTLAGLAYAVWQNWEPISKLFSNLIPDWAKKLFGGSAADVKTLSVDGSATPDWAKKPLGISLPTASGSAAGSAAATFAPPAAPAFGPSAPTLGPPVSTVGAARAQAPFEGELTVRLEGPGAQGASVEQLRSNSSALEIGVDLGPTMVMP